MSRKSIYPLFALTLALGVSQATLVEAAQPIRQTVKISDLDLSTASGQLKLDRRVKIAVYKACVKPNSSLPRTDEVLRGIEECKASARDSVQQQLVRLGLEPGVRAAKR